MKKITREKAKKNTKETVLFGLLAGLLIAGKEMLSLIPNVEIVTVLLIVYAMTFGLKALYPTYVFVLAEIFMYGIGMWAVGYLYAWGLLVLVVCLLKKRGIIRDVTERHYGLKECGDKNAVGFGDELGDKNAEECGKVSEDKKSNVRDLIVPIVVAAFFGLMFGAMSAVPMIFVGGMASAVSYFISGIPFDIAHCVGNAVTTFVLYRPLMKIMQRVNPWGQG